MLEILQHIDEHLMLLINISLSNPIFDFLFPIIRNKYTWLPLYLAVIVFFALKYKADGWKWIFFLVLTVALSDYISASIIKQIFERLRPCNNLAFVDQINTLVNCGRGYSFVSSHAANHFALAIFSINSLKIKSIRIPLVIWAVAISIAQVYVGVHYPFDIIMGAFVGILIGYATSMIHKKYFSIVL